MKFFTRKSFFTNLAIMFISVFLPYILFNILLTSLWSREIKNKTFETDTTILSLAAQTFDTVLSDTTQIMALLEFDSNFDSALDSLNRSDTKISATHVLYLNSIWSNTSRVLLSKPYVKSAYLYLEKQPNIVFTNEGVRNIENLRETSWISAYRNQEPAISLWAESLKSNPNDPGNQTESIFLFRRVPILQWDTSNEGVMVVCLDRKYFDSLLSNFPMIDTKNIYILDDKNTQIYANSNSFAETYVSLDDISIAKSQRIVKSTPDGQFLVSVVNSKHFNWTYISAVPLSIVLKQLNVMIGTAIVFSCISLALCLFLSLFITISNYRPVKLMLRMINDYNEHNTIHQVEALSRDEYGYIIYNLLQTLIQKQEVEKKLSEEIILQKESSLLALQSQINPHFLYNTLETINWEAINQLGPDNSISKILLCMASNLRYITTNNCTLVTLKEDLNHLHNYIAIHEMMNADRIAFSFRIDPAALSTKIYKLLIQPLVENAIIHGMHNTKSGGQIRICIANQNGLLKVRVVDNGCGISREQLEEIRTQLSCSSFSGGEHLGLYNIDHRIKLKYGNKFGLQLKSKVNFGTVICFSLPLEKTV